MINKLVDYIYFISKKTYKTGFVKYRDVIVHVMNFIINPILKVDFFSFVLNWMKNPKKLNKKIFQPVKQCQKYGIFGIFIHFLAEIIFSKILIMLEIINFIVKCHVLPS